MTIRGMKRAVALGVVSLIALGGLASCGRDDPAAGAEDPAVREAAKAAEAAQADLDELRAELSDLESEFDDVRTDLDDLRAQRKNAAARIERVAGRIWDSIASLRTALNEVEGTSAEIAAAFGEARAAARALSVLESRFEYHLRNDH